MRKRTDPQSELPFASEPSDRGQGAERDRDEPSGEKPKTVLSVASLDRVLKRLVEGATEAVRVRGEVRGLHRASSGHVYFTLKDEREDALVECVMYKSAPVKARHRLGEGECVVVGGHVTVFAPRGRMQLVVEAVLDSGRGELLLALERLKEKLAGEGLFAAERKKPLPREPRAIAVLTSRDGAAIHDICRVAFNRGGGAAGVRLLLLPTPVQGAGAAERIARAVGTADGIAGVDAIIVARGGGSAEDLMAYNDERVVRAVAAARLPVVSAVGHETDVCLVDLAADARAATPSQAAELLIADRREQLSAVEHLRQRMMRAMRHRLTAGRGRLARLAHALEGPRRRLLEESQRLDEQMARLGRAMQRHLRRRRDLSTALERRLHDQHPRRVLSVGRARLAALVPLLAAAMRRRLFAHRGELETAAARLDALSPLAVLGRGYAIATADGRVLTDAEQVSPGDAIEVRLAHGSLAARVERTRS